MPTPPHPRDSWPADPHSALPEGLTPVEDDVLGDAQTLASRVAAAAAGGAPAVGSTGPSEDEIDTEPTAPRTGPMTAEAMRQWQFGLIKLLARLESWRGQLAGCRYAPDADHVLDVAEAMVQLTEEFAGRYDFPDSSLDTQMATLAKAGAFYATLNDIRRPDSGHRSLLKSVFARPASEAVPAVAVRECLQQGIDALHAYFSLFTEMYRSTLRARPWVDAASAYLADFKQMARTMPEE